MSPLRLRYLVFVSCFACTAPRPAPADHKDHPPLAFAPTASGVTSQGQHPLPPLAPKESTFVDAAWTEDEALRLRFRSPNKSCVLAPPYEVANCADDENFGAPRAGLHVRAVRPGQVIVSRIEAGRTVQSVPFKIPSWGAEWLPPLPVIVGDQIGWVEQSHGGEPVTWKFSRLGSGGLSTPQKIAVLSGFGVDVCRSADEWAVEFSGTSSRVAFYSKGKWSKAIQVALSMMGAGPRGSVFTCGRGLASMTAALREGGRYRVQGYVCTPLSCEIKEASWEADGPDETLLSVTMPTSDRTWVLWRSDGAVAYKFGSWDELARTPARELEALRGGVEVLGDFARRDVAMMLYQQQGFRLLRLDGDGKATVIPVIPANERSEPADKR